MRRDKINTNKNNRTAEQIQLKYAAQFEGTRGLSRAEMERLDMTMTPGKYTSVGTLMVEHTTQQSKQAPPPTPRESLTGEYLLSENGSLSDICIASTYTASEANGTKRIYHGTRGTGATMLIESQPG